MKKLLVLLFAIAVIAACEKSDLTTDFDEPMLKSVEETGNGAPSGAHYNLNIIGVKNKKDATMDDNNGHRIFVLLGNSGLKANTKIKLTEGDSFQVLDANGTDGNGAKFQMPNPDPDGDEVTSYTVWARPLGKPGGSSSMVPCGIYEYQDTDIDGNLIFDEFGDPVMIEEEVCSNDTLFVSREKGQSKFQDVSDILLWIHLDADYLLEDGTVAVPAGDYTLFDPVLQDYFWSYDNKGLKLLQLRFYENLQ